MPKISIHVSSELEKRIRAEARRRCLGISAYVAGLLEQRVPKGWKKRFFTDVVGGWQGDVPAIERKAPEDRVP
jgi:hypothetical protein